MATRIRNQKQAAKTRGTAKRRGTAGRRRRGSTKRIAAFLVPLVFILCIVSCLGFLLFMGYRTVTASAFFDAKTIDVRGANYAARGEMEKIARGQTEKNGVWNADLEAIKNDVEKLAYVKSASVSRVLPNGIQIRVEERQPRAIVRLTAGDFWVDDEAVVLSQVGKNEQRPAFFLLRGWDESKTERAVKDNQARVRLYVKMRDEWQDAQIANRVGAVNVANLQDPQAIVEDSGASVAVFLGKEDFGKRLQKALEVIKGKGDKIESLISHGANVVAKYRNS